MRRKLLLFSVVMCLVAVCSFSVWAADPVELEYVSVNPEYTSQEAELLKLYTQKNPHVTFKVTSINEPEQAAFETRIAAGDAPAFAGRSYSLDVKSDYKNFVNLAEIDYPYWDKITYDAKGLFALTAGIEYTPTLQLVPGSFQFSFLYYSDLMEKAGFDPRATVRSWEELEQFLADLKAYTDSTDEFEFPLDMGWHSWGFGRCMLNMFAVSLGATVQDLQDLFLGKIPWNDIEANPYSPAFEKWKEWYEKGYLPERWWVRAWEQDFEAGFIAKKSMLMFHGPWIWSKTMSADPMAALTGFPLPVSNGVVLAYPPENRQGGVLYAANKDKAWFDEAVKAFIWYNSPEIVKLRGEIVDSVPLMDLADVGGVDLSGAQYLEVLQPFAEGFFGDIKWDFGQYGENLATKFKVPGKPDVLMDDAMAAVYGKYFEGEMSLQELLDICQKRFEEAYAF